VGLVLLVALAGVQALLISQSNRVRHELDASYAREIALERLLSLHQDVETGQRGYSITGMSSYLEPYTRAREQIPGAFAALRVAPGKLNLNPLELLSAQKIAFSEAVIQARVSEGEAGAMNLVRSGSGKAIMDAFRLAILGARKAEADNRESLVGTYASSSLRTQVATVALEVLLLLLLVVALFAYTSKLRQLRSATEKAQDLMGRQVAIFDAASDAMLLIDTGGNVEDANAAAERLFSLSPVELIGKSVKELFEETIYIAGFNERRMAERDEGDFRELIAYRGDRSRFEAEVAQSSVRLADSVRTLLIIRDATERNRLERMKNEFVSSVSHELRTPLTSIRGALTLFKHGTTASLDERSSKLLQIAVSNAERLTVLIDDILDIERISSGRFDLELQIVDVRSILVAAEEQNRTYAADRGIDLVVSQWPEPLIAKGDVSRLIQALTNLISNAAKFSPAGHSVKIDSEQVDGFARLSVADQGPGLPLELRPRLFGRFAQAAGHSEKRAGTGLGLAITKAIIDQHNGSIHYDSELGKGTRFSIDLPLVR
jgi:PAS domain S-box-containing protein